MAFKDLFKTKAEREAYAKGRKDQYNKEHPKLRWGVETTTFRFNSDGSLDGKSTRVFAHNKYQTKQEARDALTRAVKSEKYQERRVLDAVRKRKVNVRDSDDCQFDKFRLVRINERKK